MSLQSVNGAVGGGGNGTAGRHKVPRLRLSMLAVVATALFASLFARLYDLQVVGSSDYQVQAEANRVRTVQVPAPRGRIVDRNGKVLVDNRVAVVVAIDRNVFGDLAEAEQAALLQRLTGELTAAGQVITPEEVTERLRDQRYSRYAPVPVATDVPEDLKIYLEEHAAEFPSVVVERTPVREYPYGNLAAHILGYVGKINDDELAFVEASDDTAKPYALNDEIGKTGVERTYERYLRGTPGVRRIEVDAEGDPVRVISEREPRPGDDLVLSIDIDLQAVAEQALQQGLADARARPPNRDNPPNNATTGAVVVEDPNNGQLLALASYPTYDPTAFVDGIDANEWAYLNDPANHYPLNNWAIQGQWAPGSTYKLFMGYAALHSGLMAPDTIFYDGGGYLIPGCTGLKCYRSNAGGAAHGAVNISEALTVSSDAFFYNVGAQFWLQRERFGDEGLQGYLAPWGVGEETGVALTGERPGRIAGPTWKREYNEPIGGDTVWRTGDSVNVGVGQGDVLVTPLQLANGYATFANGGTRYVPQVALRAQTYRTGDVTQEFAPEAAGRVEIAPQERQALLDGLANVPVRGTAAGAFAGFPLEDFPIAGKTGTAQVDNKADTALFSAFGPVNAPRYQVTAVLEESGFGATSAAPVVRRVFEVLAGVTPRPVAGPNGLPVNPEGGGLVGGGGAGYD
ncbi:MAG TPA: penicillin-binding protein 2 [Acidimicrobiales bacterium]|jgi:penicillin-binding protein 2|nr:penicillin-binding protein 2 [Acidimicrobiales bacterium]